MARGLPILVGCHTTPVHASDGWCAVVGVVLVLYKLEYKPGPFMLTLRLLSDDPDACSVTRPLAVLHHASSRPRSLAPRWSLPVSCGATG